MTRNSRTLTLLAAALLLPLGGALAADTATPAKEAPKVAKKQPLDCTEATVSRIRRNLKEGECPKSATPSRTYSKQDLESTGQTDVNEALKRLDPRFH